MQQAQQRGPIDSEFARCAGHIGDGIAFGDTAQQPRNALYRRRGVELFRLPFVGISGSVVSDMGRARNYFSENMRKRRGLFLRQRVTSVRDFMIANSVGKRPIE